jgi:hypothetical protein
VPCAVPAAAAAALDGDLAVAAPVAAAGAINGGLAVAESGDTPVSMVWVSRMAIAALCYKDTT